MTTKIRHTGDTLEQLCWYLNYHTERSLDPVTIADETGLDWAEVYNAIILLERLQNTAPTVEYDSDRRTVTVENGPDRIEGILRDPTLATVVYLFMYGKHHSGVTEPLILDEHSLFKDQNYQDGLTHAVELGWATVTEDTAAITSRGAGVAGPLYSQIQNGVGEHDC